MNKGGFAALNLLMALGLSLSACGGGGGGGVDSTPTPAPTSTPAPSPGPSPSPTSSPTPTSAPTPTPTPGVGSLNSSLNPLTVTEDFPSDAVHASLVNGGGQSIGPSTLSLRYDASVNVYIIAAQGNGSVFTQSTKLPLYDGSNTSNTHNGSNSSIYYPFSRSDPSIILSASTPGLNIYSSFSATTAEQLILSSNTFPIIASDPLKDPDIILTYAGFGAYFFGSKAPIAGSFEYFTYGAFTAANAMPQVGSGTYSYVMDGRLASTSTVFVQGFGIATADFGAGTVRFRGGVGEADPVTGMTAGWSPLGEDSPFKADTLLASSANSFSGTFSYSGPLSGAKINGQINGRFYGPSAQEIGAVFSGTNGGALVTGAIVGSRGSSLIK